MRFLFVKETFAWPRSAGHDIHTYYMMRALEELGHEIAVLTFAPVAAEALAGLSLVQHFDGAKGLSARMDVPIKLGRLQEKFRSYWGIDQQRIQLVSTCAEEIDADAVVVGGLEVLPYLAGVKNRVRIWYAGDEWLWHHLSQVKSLGAEARSNVKEALVKGLYEWAFADRLDRVWVVSEADRKAFRWVTGSRNVDVIANGIDSDHFAPRPAVTLERHCTFWGRLDFGPNLDALDFFVGKVWPIVRSRHQDAQFDIFGFQPGERAKAFGNTPGVRIIADLPDLRDEIAKYPVVVFPFVTGGGIKNKLLEAAAMAKSMVVSTVACNGLHLPAELPMILARPPKEWSDAICSLWANPHAREDLGQRAREWVIRDHSWLAAGQIAAKGTSESLARIGRNPSRTNSVAP